MKKYYTPEPEEFYIGFEYRVCDIETAQYVDCVFEDGQSVENLLDGDSGEVVVKYLDKEDIESLGFEGQKANSTYFKRDGYKLVYWPHGYITSIYKVYDSTEETNIFDGYIKNKSELKKLLKQLNIIE